MTAALLGGTAARGDGDGDCSSSDSVSTSIDASVVLFVVFTMCMVFTDNGNVCGYVGPWIPACDGEG